MLRVTHVNKRYFIASNQKRSLSPFCASVGYPCQVQISLFPKMVMLLAWIKRSPPSANIPFPLLIVAPHVQSRSSHANTLTCLGWCNVHKPNAIILYYWDVMPQIKIFTNLTQYRVKCMTLWRIVLSMGQLKSVYGQPTNRPVHGKFRLIQLVSTVGIRAFNCQS